jgi:hypothetical protein
VAGSRVAVRLTVRSTSAEIVAAIEADKPAFVQVCALSLHLLPPLLCRRTSTSTMSDRSYGGPCCSLGFLFCH